VTRLKPWATIAWLLFLFSVPLWLGDLYVLHLLVVTGIFIIAAMSLNLLLGYTGQLSLGHVAFFGIGAYVSSLVALGFEVHPLPNWPVRLEPKPVWVSMLAGIVFAGGCGWAIGKLSFKVRGAYFVIVSVSFAEVVRLVALNWVELTQGPMALNNIPPLRLGIPGWFEVSFLRKPANYYLVLVVAVLCYVLIRRLVNSRAGRAMVALRENEALATSVGVDVTRYLVLATMISAAMAGAAGALYAHYVRIVDPDVFLFIYTVTMVIMVISGGKGTLAGPVVGGLIFGLLPELLRVLANAMTGPEIAPPTSGFLLNALRAFATRPEMQWIVYGVLMVLVVYFLPQGIVPAVRDWWTRREAGGAIEPPAATPTVAAAR
jgi:branched-chain amino acid transport system permease protein